MVAPKGKTSIRNPELLCNTKGANAEAVFNEAMMKIDKMINNQTYPIYRINKTKKYVENLRSLFSTNLKSDFIK